MAQEIKPFDSSKLIEYLNNYFVLAEEADPKCQYFLRWVKEVFATGESAVLAQYEDIKKSIQNASSSDEEYMRNCVDLRKIIEKHQKWQLEKPGDDLGTFQFPKG